MRLLLDSTFVIDLLDGVPEATARQRTIFETGDEPFVNEVVVCEVRAGMDRRDQPGLVGILEPVEFIQPGPESALLAGEWRRSAHERGYHLSLPDALIAAAAEAIDAAVLTRNLKDFALTPVRTETY
jgi:predicted nucleic acid-binding protein